mmetsp:Transcript_20424/g.62341  ORF Transcript_20424/g.62341 Transcript_20424/m.62341 type:complete len:243 (+) Transcript_20424:384-1112(+)
MGAGRGAAVRLLPQQPGRAGRADGHPLPHLLAPLLPLCHPLPDRHHRGGPHPPRLPRRSVLRVGPWRLRAAAHQGDARALRPGVALHVHEHGQEPQGCLQEAVRKAAAAAKGAGGGRVPRGQQGRPLDFGGGQEGVRGSHRRQRRRRGGGGGGKASGRHGEAVARGGGAGAVARCVCGARAGVAGLRRGEATRCRRRRLPRRQGRLRRGAPHRLPGVRAGARQGRAAEERRRRSRRRRRFAG